MENENQKTSDKDISKLKHFGVLDWIVLVVCIFMLPGSIILMISDAPTLFLFGKTENLSQFVADIVGLILSIWGLRVKLKKFKELKTQKSYKAVRIISWAVAVLIIIPAIFSIYLAFHNPKVKDQKEQNQKLLEDSKPLDYSAFE